MVPHSALRKLAQADGSILGQQIALRVTQHFKPTMNFFTVAETQQRG